MRSVSEYLEKATEFDRLAEEATLPALAKRFADMADCYRVLARERRRLIEEGFLNPSDFESPN